LIQASLPLLLKQRGSYGSATFAVLRNRHSQEKHHGLCTDPGS